jgi:hypothetical protein
MKKLVLVVTVLTLTTAAFAQADKKNQKNKVFNTAGDHIMLQLGTENWGNLPDSVSRGKRGFWRSTNLYVMLNKPFKKYPEMSVAIGLGVGTGSAFFKKTNVGINSTGARLPFTSLDSAQRFKKYKLNTAFLEIPVELRFVRNTTTNKTFKVAIGVKVGTLLSVSTKGKTLEDKNGRVVSNYVEKIKDKKFFNGTRLAATARVGYGIYSLFASYQINSLLKDGVGPQIRPLQIGLCISGL